MKISILGIGTELTSGQILNRNGQWISQQIQGYGVTTSMHVVVPDEERLILEALAFCASHSDILFVTGGLGPTSDDFTRDVIAKWTGRTLKWDESSWKHIEDRLLLRGIAVKEIQRQQCYFPEGSQVLKNKMGTANAFCLEHEGREIFVLPGPPKEIQSVWEDHISSRLKEKFKSVDALITRSWDTIGWGESDIADRVETALKGCDYEKGYRVHMPYVEVKLSYLKSQSQEAEKWLSAVDEALRPMTVLRDNADAAECLCDLLFKFPQVLVLDQVPGSFLLQRLLPVCKDLLKEKKLNFLSSFSETEDVLSAGKNSDSTVFLHLQEDSPGFARALFSYRGQQRMQLIASPYTTALMKERGQQYFAEMALLFWMREASQLG
jgi:molybdenum cofactor synthesis domain-containing protein